MKKLLLLIIGIMLSVLTYAQVPYFGSSAGKDKLYNYTQVKFHPGVNKQSFYTSFNYGLLSNMDITMNYNSATETNAWGLKYSFLNTKHIKLALQADVNFMVSDNYKFDNVTTGLFINGYIVDKLSYISNTWYTQYDRSSYFEQWTYLGYDINKLILNVGAVTDLSNNCKSDLVVGLWYPFIKSGSIYLWAGNLIKNLGDIKVTIGFDFKF